MADSIGTFNFLALRGTPIWPVEQVKIIQRAGVDGSAFLFTGKRCPPFQLLSIVDAADMETGAAGLLLYQDLIDDAPVALVQGGVDWSDAGLYVKVLDVQQRALYAALVAGGLTAGSTAILEAVWTLQGLEYSGAGGS